MSGFAAHGATAHGGITAFARVFYTKQTLYFSSHSFSTLATDKPASTPIAGRLLPFSYSSEIGTDSQGRFAGAAAVGFGQIILENGDNALDGLLRDTISDGAEVSFFVGRTTQDAYGRRSVWPFANFGRVIVATAEQWKTDGINPQLQLRDATMRLNRPAQPNLFPGTGGINGGLEIAGLTKPLCYGPCLNVRPVMLDRNLLTFMVHPNPIKAVDAVRDSGIELFPSGDYPTYDDLSAADVEPGFFATCLAAGVFRVGAGDQNSQITADVRGAAEGKVVSFFSDGSSWSDGTGFANRIAGVYVDTTAAIIARLMTDFSIARPDEIESTSFSLTDRDQPASVGIFLPAGDSSSLLAVIDALTLGIGAWFGQDTFGRYQLARFERPDPSAKVELTSRQIIAMRRAELPYRVPPYLWQVAYQRNFTLQDDSQLAFATTDQDRGIAVRERVLATAENDTIRAAAPTRVGLVEAYFQNLVDAAAEAQRLADLYTLGAGLHELILPMIGLRFLRGMTIRVVYGIAGFQTGRAVRIIGMRVDLFNRQTTLTVFG